jgi:hypothetical protein
MKCPSANIEHAAVCFYNGPYTIFNISLIKNTFVQVLIKFGQKNCYLVPMSILSENGGLPDLRPFTLYLYFYAQLLFHLKKKILAKIDQIYCIVVRQLILPGCCISIKFACYGPNKVSPV